MLPDFLGKIFFVPEARRLVQAHVDAMKNLTGIDEMRAFGALNLSSAQSGSCPSPQASDFPWFRPNCRQRSAEDPSRSALPQIPLSICPAAYGREKRARRLYIVSRTCRRGRILLLGVNFSHYRRQGGVWGMILRREAPDAFMLCEVGEYCS